VRQAVVIVAALALAASPAHGQAGAAKPSATSEQQARELSEMGQRHFDLGEYDDAIHKYRAAYRLDPRPGLLFNLGQSYRLKGDCVSAQAMYRGYLRLEPESRYKALVEQHLASLERCAREQAAAGRRAADDPSTTSDDVRDPGRTRRIAGVATAGVGVLLIGAGGWFALDARDAADDVSAAYDQGGDWEDIEAIDARGRRSEKIAVVCAGAGAIAVVAGVGLYVLGHRAERAAQVSVQPRPGGGTVGVSWTW
jgi:tetratricopeptide (TPR) repeat protein